MVAEVRGETAAGSETQRYGGAAGAEGGPRAAGCWRCGGPAAATSFFCARCGAVQAPAPDADHFALLGLPRRLVIDAGELERRYHELSRELHPDRFPTAGSREREASLAASAALNRAYRTLADPVARGRYWLELHGEELGRDNREVPAAIAAEVFEVQEDLAELRAARHAGAPEAASLAAELGQAREKLEGRIAAERRELERRFATWEEAGIAGSKAALAELKASLSALAYLGTLVRDLEKETEPQWSGS